MWNWLFVPVVSFLFAFPALAAEVGGRRKRYSLNQRRSLRHQPERLRHSSG